MIAFTVNGTSRLPSSTPQNPSFAPCKFALIHDGKISDVKVVRSSGNVVMDESVMSAAQRVLKIDPLPAGLGSGGAYTVNINFELQ